MVGVCRHFATLYVALLRHRGTPARARCGFGGYFMVAAGIDEWIDHWVTEYWDAARDRWVRADPQFDETHARRASPSPRTPPTCARRRS